MSKESNNQGRAYEFAFINTLHEEIKKVRSAEIVQNSSYEAGERAWNAIEDGLKFILSQSSLAAVETVFDMEPMMLEASADVLELKIQADTEGKAGDVRDIVISRPGVKWEIGLSIKHNHFAVKHSRLSGVLDFAEKWFGVPCSREYWDTVRPIFEYLEKLKAENKDWRDLPSKNEAVYVPVLQAFIDEVRRSCEKDKSVPRKMVEYLLGEFDFYKVISIDSKRITQIQTFNLHGTLNKASRTTAPKIKVPRAILPTRIVCLDFKPGSKNTAELYMDNGWQFSFRIHNASTKVEPSLKFDITIIGMPSTIISIDCRWS